MRSMRVVVVTGPRQAGKSRLVRRHRPFSGRPYFTLDDARVLLDAQADRRAFLASEPEMTIDEVQRDPALLLEIKLAVDAQRRKKSGQFLLTGSANLLMMKHVSDSLAGRAYYLRLQPMTRREQLGEGTTGIWTKFFRTPVGEWLDLVRDEPARKEEWRAAVRRGGFPGAAVELDRNDQPSIWFDGYVATYLERDLRDLQAVGNLQDFRALMRAAALRIGNLLNHVAPAFPTQPENGLYSCAERSSFPNENDFHFHVDRSHTRSHNRSRTASRLRSPAGATGDLEVLQGFVITLREGIEAFLIVAISFAYLRKTGRRPLLGAVRWGIAASVALSLGAAVLFRRASNQALWEGVLALAAAVLVASLTVHMWRAGRRLRGEIERRLEREAERTGPGAWVGVFLFTLLMITREGMETVALLGSLLFQVQSVPVITGALAGLAGAAGVAWLWARYGHRVNLGRFFQVTAVFLLVFVVQLIVYGFHELTEAAVLPYSESLHWATEPYGPDGRYGQFLTYLLVLLPVGWLTTAFWLDRRGAPVRQA